MKEREHNEEWLMSEDFEVIKRFLGAVKDLSENKRTFEKLKLQRKVPGILSEIFVINALHERGYRIMWHGGGTHGKDITIRKEGKEQAIQIKKMTAYEPSNKGTGKKIGTAFYHWNFRDEMKDYSKKEGDLELFPDKLPPELGKRFNYPYIFVYISDDLQPSFFVLSKDEMANKAYGYIRDGKNNWLHKTQEKFHDKGKKQGNIRDAWLVFFEEKPVPYPNESEFKDNGFFKEDCIDKFSKLLDK